MSDQSTKTTPALSSLATRPLVQPLATTVYLSRHGETEWNLQARFQGQGDSPLTPNGLAQAEQLADELAVAPLDVVFSSDLGRAVTTARRVAERHGLTVRTHPGLREMDMGDWSGLSRDEAALRWPVEREQFRLSPASVRFPNGESFPEAQRRALNALAELLDPMPGARVAVITHGTLLETVLAEALGLGLSALWLRLAQHCQPHLLEYADGRLRTIRLAGGVTPPNGLVGPSGH